MNAQSQQYQPGPENRPMYGNLPDHHPGPGLNATTPTGPRKATTPQNIPTHNFYPNTSNNVSYNPSAGDRMSPRSLDQDTYSGGSLSSYRPPSAQSAGYRLATGLVESDSEGYLAPRSSAGSSYQFNGTPRPIAREHDSGVDIDNSGHHDNQSHSSDLSAKDNVQFQRNGAIAWTADGKPGLDKPQLKNVRPDSLAFRSHDYEELPLKKDQYVYADVDDNARTNASVPHHETTGSQDNLTGQGANSQYRRRQNPLYDAVIREDSKASGKTDGGVTGCSRCLCVSIVVLALLSGLALILALVAMSGAASFAEADSARTVYMVSTPSYAQIQLAMDRIEELENRYEDLLAKIAALETTSDLAVLISNISQQNDRLSVLGGSVQQIQMNFGTFRTEIETAVDDISKMQGPQGPPGAGNLSQCENKRTSVGRPNMETQFTTGWKPSPDDNMRYVILGVDCTTTLAKTSFLEVTETNGYKQYRCMCMGSTNLGDSGNRYCDLNMWRCPKIS